MIGQAAQRDPRSGGWYVVVSSTAGTVTEATVTNSLSWTTNAWSAPHVEFVGPRKPRPPTVRPPAYAWEPVPTMEAARVAWPVMVRRFRSQRA